MHFCATRGDFKSERFFKIFHNANEFAIEASLRSIINMLKIKKHLKTFKKETLYK